MAGLEPGCMDAGVLVTTESTEGTEAEMQIWDFGSGEVEPRMGTD